MARRLAPLAGLLLVVAAAFAWWSPFLTQKRPVLSVTPSPPGLFGSASTKLPAGGIMCLTGISIAPDSEIATLVAQTYRRPGPEVAIEFSAPGYKYRPRAQGYGANAPLRTPLAPPGESTVGSLCLRNVDRRPVAFLSTAEPRTLSRPTTSVNRTEIAQDVALSFERRKTASLISRPGEVFDHANAFTWGILGRPFFALLALTLALGLPLGRSEER